MRIAVCSFLQIHRNADALAENVLGQTLGFLCFIAILFLPEVLKISAVVKNQKAPFVSVLPVDLVDAAQSLAQTGAPANHLPEFCFGAHFLKEHQIDTFRSINSGIHHIDRNSNMRFLFRYFKIINHSLRIGVLADNPLRKAAVLGIELVKALQDKLCMTLVLRKDDGFTQTVTACHLDAALHQILKDGVHRCLIKHKLIELCRWDKIRKAAVIFNKVILVTFLVGIRQIFVCNTFLQKLGFDLVVVVRHQHMILINRGFVVVGIGRDIMWSLKKVIGIAVNIGLWGCRQSNQYRVKVFKDGAVLFKDAAVTFVNDNQIKVSRCEQPLSLKGLGVVDGIEDGRIGRKDDAGIAIVLVGAKVAQ